MFSFFCSWVIRYVVEGKANTLRHAQHERPGVMTAVGVIAFELRHGYGSALADGRIALTAARDAQGVWELERTETASFWQRLTAGWRDGWRMAGDTLERWFPRPETVPAAPPPTKPVVVPTTPTAKTAPTPAPAPSSAPTQPNGRPPAPVLPFRKEPGMTTPASTNGTSVAAAGEGGYNASVKLAGNLTTAFRKLSIDLETYEAGLIAGGLLGDQNVMKTLAAVKEAVANAATAMQAHGSALANHKAGAEYAQTQGAAAAKTEWLGRE